MEVRAMNETECNQMVSRATLARLGCARNDQPYIVPVTLVYHGSADEEPCLYGFTTLGMKIAWMGANPNVCVLVDDIKAIDEWKSVIVFGRYEELPEIPGADDARMRAAERPQRLDEVTTRCQPSEEERMNAYRLLRSRAKWWEPGSAAGTARFRSDSTMPYVPIYYKIRIDRVTGREAVPDARNAVAHATPSTSAGTWKMMRQTLAGLFGSASKARTKAS
jgi:hypothetical protein